MTNAELILLIQDKYDKKTREEILACLNISIGLGKEKGLKVDRYVALPEVTNKTKHTVMSWFNRPDTKIPLVNLCMLARYLGYNIFSFFETKENGITKGEFLIANDKYSHMYPNAEEIFIMAYNLQHDTDKRIVLDNLEKYYGTSQELLKHHSIDRQVQILEITGCTKDAYRSWFNRSRENVRIPLIALCKLAKNANIDIFDLFSVR